MEEAINNFNDYINQFDMHDFNIRLKKEHTFRVVELAQELSEKLELNEEDTKIFLLIALLHDIGRFYQLQKYHSFSDLIFDHATCGVEYLFKEGHIREYNPNQLNDEIIEKAIYYHNRYVSDIKETGRVRMFINLIRDIDKIDIFYVMYLKFQQEFDKKEITEEKLKSFRDKIPVRVNKKLNKSEDFLMKCAFIFEFNYHESLELLQEKGYLDLFFTSVKVSTDSEDLFQEIKKIIYEEINARLEEKDLGDVKYVRKKI